MRYSQRYNVWVSRCAPLHACAGGGDAGGAEYKRGKRFRKLVKLMDSGQAQQVGRQSVTGWQAIRHLQTAPGEPRVRPGTGGTVGPPALHSPHGKSWLRCRS